jgi:phage baseplate assembly protein V
MPEGLAQLAARLFAEAPEERIQGVALAVVLDNIDLEGEGRVQVQLPWLPGFEPWARVAVPVAGQRRGLWLIPQVGDEVLVAFDGGDVTSPYVIGSLWNGTDLPPTTSSLDAETKTILHTPAGHVIELDDQQQTVRITTTANQKLTLGPDKIQLESGSSKATFETSGSVTIESSTELTLKSSTIKIQGTSVSVEGSADLSLKGSASASLQGGVVRIN